MATSLTVTKNTRTIPDKIYMPSQSYTRSDFYETTQNVRYFIKFSLTNGQQAEDIPIGIENLIEFIGDVEMLIDKTDNINVRFKNHSHWSAKLSSE